MAYIYEIINIVNNKRYIGETLNLEQRFQRHWHDLKNNCHHSSKLQRAFNKYGQDSFVTNVIAEVRDEDRFEWEQHYIQKYNTFFEGYNETSGGDNPGFEVLQKVVYCYSFEGEYLDEWYISGREASRQLHIDQGLLQKICTGQKKSATDIQGRKLRFSYELKDSLEPITTHENQKKKIYQYNQSGELINTYDCKGDAAEALGLARSTRGGFLRALESGKLYHNYYWKER